MRIVIEHAGWGWGTGTFKCADKLSQHTSLVTNFFITTFHCFFFLSISGNGLWQSNMTAGNIQNSKRISLYGSKQTHGIDWQNHFFLFSHLKQFRDDKSHPESLHTTNEKGPKHVTFSPHLPESRWHRYTFLNPCVHTKEKKKTLKQQYQFLFPGCGGGGTFWPAYRRSCAFPKIRKTTKTKPKKA